MRVIDELLARLPASVERAIPDWAGAAAAVEQVSERPRSTLIWCSLKLGSRTLRLIVKIPRLIERPPSERPRFVPDTPAVEKMRLEATTLGMIHDDPVLTEDQRFGAVRIIDVYDDLGAIVMTQADGAPLSRLLLRSVGPRRDPRATAKVGPALTNAGAWLRRFQVLPNDRPARVGTRAEMIDLARGIGEYVGSSTARVAVVRDAVDLVVGTAEDMFPETLPVGLNHGDFAVRNLLVDDPGAVTVIDAVGRWRMPIYDDLARMLVGLETSRVQTSSFGLAFSAAHRARLHDALLAGYGRDLFEPGPLRLYSILILLDKWAAAVEQRQTSRRRLRRVPSRLIDGQFARVVRGFLSPLNPEAR